MLDDGQIAQRARETRDALLALMEALGLEYDETMPGTDRSTYLRLRISKYQAQADILAEVLGIDE